MNRQWLFSKRLDLIFLFIPIWISWGICFLFDKEFAMLQLPIVIWVIVVLGIDVTHVWSTIFRTYLSSTDRSIYSRSLYLAPIIAFIVAFISSWYSEHLFWRLLAYFALYHFIKQQYGFLRLYNLHTKIEGRLIKDKWIIYIATLFPVFVWHFLGDRKFNWFNINDFIIFPVLSTTYVQVLNYIYFSLLLIWFIDILYCCVKTKQRIPIGKLLWVFSTFGTWWLGIIYFNSDFSFTITNVVAHGIPYMALVFYYVEEKKEIEKQQENKKLQVLFSILWMFSICLFLGWSEEMMWDVFINNEREEVFGSWLFYIDKQFFRAIVIALLSLPQITHYILDGIIWKGKGNSSMKQIFSR